MNRAVFAFSRAVPLPAVAAPIACGWRNVILEKLIRIMDRLGDWQDRSAARQRLAVLDERMLHDIGVDRASAAAEADKPFWQC